MDPLDFLALANRLKHSPDEIERRTSVNRAYYAVYHHIRSYLVNNNIPLRIVRRHEALIRCLRNSGIPEVEVLGDTVGDLMDDRHDADYTLHLRRFTAGTCSEFCDTCQAAIDDFDQHKGSGLINGVRQYLQDCGDISSRSK